MEHEANHGESDHSLGHLRQVLVVPGQAAPAPEPAECALHNPPARQKDKTLHSPRTADDEQRKAEPEAGQDGWHAVVAAVGEHGAEPAIQRLDASEQAGRAVCFLNGSGVNNHAQQQPLRVHGDVALATRNLLGGVVAARTAGFCGLHTLAVDDCGREAWLPACALAQHGHEVVAHGLPHARIQEGAEVAVSGRPRQERGRRRQVPPLAAGAQHVEQGVQHASLVDRTRAPSRLGRRDQRLQQPPPVARRRLARPVVPHQRTILWCPHLPLQTGQNAWNAAPPARVTPSDLAHTPFQNGPLGPLLTKISFTEYFAGKEFLICFRNLFGLIQFNFPDVFENNPLPRVVNLSLWTISYELECYLAIILCASTGIVKWPTLLLAAVAALMLSFIIYSWATYGALVFLTPNGRLLIIAFLVGTLAFLIRDRIPASKRAALLSLATYVVLASNVYSSPFLFYRLFILPYILEHWRQEGFG